jgi:hypothetical protein
VLVLLVDDEVSIGIAEVVLVLGIHFAQLGSYSLSGDYSSHPRLKPHNHIHASLEVLLFSSDCFN